MKTFVATLGLLLAVLTTPVLAQQDTAAFMDPADQFNKALHHLLGTQGESKSPTTAFLMFEELANQDFAAAQHMVGKLYETGNGVDQDYTQAWYWYQRAVTNGFASSQTRLARLEKRMTAEQRERAASQFVAQGY